MKKCNVMTK